MGTVETSGFYNRYLASSDLIGTESVDPPFSLSSFANTPYGSCSGTVRCRRSDMALIRSSISASGVDFGRIARRAFFAYGRNAMGSLQPSEANPPMRIIGEDDTPEMNQIMDRVGCATGRTYGEITATRTDTRADFRPDRNPTSIVMRCSTYVGPRRTAGRQRGAGLLLVRRHGDAVRDPPAIWAASGWTTPYPG